MQYKYHMITHYDYNTQIGQSNNFDHSECAIELTLHSRYFFMLLLLSDNFFKIISFTKILSEIQEHYQSVKQFGCRSRPTLCQS